MWYAYEEMERAYVSSASADAVWTRGVSARGEETAADAEDDETVVASSFVGSSTSAPKVTPSVESLPNSALQQAARSARELLQAAQQQQRANARASIAEQEYGLNSGPRVVRQTDMGELRG